MGEAYRLRVGKFIKKLMVEPVYVTDEVADRNNISIDFANKSIDNSFQNPTASKGHMRFNSILVASQDGGFPKITDSTDKLAMGRSVYANVQTDGDLNLPKQATL